MKRAVAGLLLSAVLCQSMAAAMPDSVPAQSTDNEYRLLLGELTKPGKLDRKQERRVEDFVAGNPGSWRAHLVAAALHERLGMLGVADQDYHRCWRSAPGEPQALLALMSWKVRQGDDRQMDELIARAEIVVPGNFQVWMLKAMRLARKGDRLGCRKALRKAGGVLSATLKPEARDIFNLALSGRLSEGVTAAEKLAAKYPDDPAINLLLVATLMAAGEDHDIHLRLYKVFQSAPLRPMTAQLYARSLLARGMATEALEPTLALLAASIIAGSQCDPIKPALRRSLSQVPEATIEKFADSIGKHIEDRDRKIAFFSTVGDLLAQARRTALAARQYGHAADAAPAQSQQRRQLLYMQALMANRPNDLAGQIKDCPGWTDNPWSRWYGAERNARRGDRFSGARSLPGR